MFCMNTFTQLCMALQRAYITRSMSLDDFIHMLASNTYLFHHSCMSGRYKLMGPFSCTWFAIDQNVFKLHMTEQITYMCFCVIFVNINTGWWALVPFQATSEESILYIFSGKKEKNRSTHISDHLKKNSEYICSFDCVYVMLEVNPRCLHMPSKHSTPIYTGALTFKMKDGLFYNVRLTLIFVKNMW